PAMGDPGRLIATGGATSIEGSAGGGITPWAVITGYSEQGEWGATAFATHVNLPDYNLDVAGAGGGLWQPLGVVLCASAFRYQQPAAQTQPAGR
ncbi:DUF3034 family protein, partial [Pseudomonas congelans]|uniref:DUF3034 family protein n=1 Tax=Pseudomonas congelans TaxID=200452 RepID=UPI002729DE7D